MTRRSKQRRFGVRLAGSLVIGVVLAVLTAEGLSLYHGVRISRRPWAPPVYHPIDGQEMIASTESAFGYEHWMLTGPDAWSYHLLHGPLRPPGWAVLPAPPAPGSASSSAFGWPLRSAMWYFRGYFLAGPDEYEVRGRAEWGIAGTRLGVVWIPIWSGLVANSLVFGAVAFAATEGRRRVRGAVRARGNRCRGCGYSRAGLGVGVACPECGEGAG